MHLILFASLLIMSASADIIEGNLPLPVKPEPRQLPLLPPPVKPEPRVTQFTYAFTSVGQQALVQSPNYPNSYPANVNIQYSLTSPPNTIMQLVCNDFNVESSTSCQSDRFYFSLSGDQSLQDMNYACGKGTFQKSSISNSLTVGFISDASNPASFSVYRYGCTLTVAEATVVTPTFPTTTTAPPATAQTANASCTCGVRNEAIRIVGGTNAVLNEFPWRCNLNNPQMGVFCGATVISSSWIMTAAHCTKAIPADVPLYVDCGDHDISTTTESVNQQIKVVKVIQNANYNDETQDNDISLLKLEKPLTLGRNVQPICLPWNMVGKSVQGTTAVTSGWGTLTSGGKQPMVIQKVDLPVLTTQQCQQYYGTSVTKNMICTYNPGKDTCQGDSGGSIDYKDPSTGRYSALGVVSWGVGCAGVNQPGVYTYVNNYLGWIQAQTGETFCQV